MSDMRARDTTLPRLSHEQIGHIRHFVHLANMLPGEWGGMGDGGLGWLAVPERTLRYQLANMAYALATVQTSITPAYRDIYKHTIHALLRRLLEPDCWKEWVNVSRGGRFQDPVQTELKVGEFDPLKQYNVMYGGHLLQVAALYEMLYMEGRYTQPDSLHLTFAEGNWGFGPYHFKYDILKIADSYLSQFAAADYRGCPCEPTLTFAMCPQHAMLGIILADHLRGTDHARALSEAYLKRWHEMGWVNPETGSVRYAYRRTDQQFIEMPPGPWSDGWTFAFMHAWAPDYVRSLYPRQRDRHVPDMMDRRRTGLPLHPADSTAGIGYFGVLAAEVGDTDTVRTLLDFADTNLSPTWIDGRLFYPRNDDPTIDSNGILRCNTAMAGNALIPFTRLLKENGLRSLHSRPWGKEGLSAVSIHSIDYDAAAVTQAIWREDARTLHVAFEPGPRAQQGTASFRVSGLDEDRDYVLRQNGQLIGSLSRGADKDAFHWQTGAEPEISFDPRRATEFQIEAAA
jgi:hypothetical protein